MKLEIYKKANDISEFDELIELLGKNEILFRIEEIKEIGDQLQVGHFSGFKYFLKIRLEDTERVDELVSDNFAITLAEVPRDFYMFDFSDEELMEVIVFKEEWGKEDIKIASLILKERGIDPDNIPIEKVKEVRIKSESETEPSPKVWLVVGYGTAFLGGFLGIGIGLTMWLSKRTLSDNSKIYDFEESDRKQGKLITIIGTVMFVVWIIIWKKLRT